jgi:glycosyltransferase involved in cell wall biosynthesis
MQYKVTIITAVYKVEPFIEKCVRSLFEQTLEEIQFIFVDDCSPDRSVEIVRNILEQYPQRKDDVLIIRNKFNRGLSAVRNIGLSNATGEYIGWVDGDDWVDNTMFEKLYNTAFNNVADVTWCDFHIIESTGTTYTKKQILKKECAQEFAKAIMMEKISGSLCNKLIRRDLIEQYSIRFIEGSDIGDDTSCSIRVMSIADNIKYCPMPSYQYVRYNNNSLTINRANPKRAKWEIANAKECLSFLQKYHKDWLTSKEVSYYKLRSKEFLLLSLDYKDFKTWTHQFPETNYAMLNSDRLQFRHKIIALLSILKCWWILRLWTSLKRWKNEISKL